MSTCMCTWARVVASPSVTVVHVNKCVRECVHVCLHMAGLRWQPSTQPCCLGEAQGALGKRAESCRPWLDLPDLV